MDRTEASHGGAHASCAHVRGQGNAAEVPHSVLSSPLLSRPPATITIHINSTSPATTSQQWQCNPHPAYHYPTRNYQSHTPPPPRNRQQQQRLRPTTQFKTPKGRGCWLHTLSKASVCKQLEALQVAVGAVDHRWCFITHRPRSSHESTPETSRKRRELAGALPEGVTRRRKSRRCDLCGAEILQTEGRMFRSSTAEQCLPG